LLVTYPTPSRRLVWFVGVTALSAQIGYIVPQGMKYILCRLGETHSNIDKPNKRKIHTNNLFHLGFVEIISPHEGV